MGFQRLFTERPEPRVGIHYGATLYRDGDYFGREVNTASRVVARARGGEVLVTDAVVDRVSESDHLVFEGVGQVKLKGFDEPRQLFRAGDARGRGLSPWTSPPSTPPGPAGWWWPAGRCWSCSPVARIRSACWTWRCDWRPRCRRCT